MHSLPDEYSSQALLLDATERLVYAGGINATGMDAIVKTSGVARKTIYRHYPTKEALVAAALRRRHARWMRWFVDSTSTSDDPLVRLISIFPALREWFGSADFHGCAFLNAAGEIGDASSEVRAVAWMHKEKLLDYLLELTQASRQPDAEDLARQFLILINGAIADALIFGGSDAANTAERAARRLMQCPPPAPGHAISP